MRVEDGSVRRQLSKACKKIFKVFRGVIECPTENYDIDDDFSAIGFKTGASFLFSEVQLHLVMSQQLVYGLQSHHRACYVPIKTKVFEQALSQRREDFDCYTCLVLAVQRTRNIFLREVNRFVEVFLNFCQSQNYTNSMHQVKRLVRNMIETNLARQLKLPRITFKQKAYQQLLALNEEVALRRKSYNKEAKEKKDLIVKGNLKKKSDCNNNSGKSNRPQEASIEEEV